MNAVMTHNLPFQPLPAALVDSAFQSLPHRRQAIGNYRPAQTELARFNQLLARLGRTLPLDLDQLATAARQLPPPDGGQNAPACIAERIARLETVAAMVVDPDWRAANEAMDCARLVLDYSHERRRLIPGSLPWFGHLDDAIVVEAAWPLLGREAAHYQDFLRLRVLEAYLRGCAVDELHLDRRYWEAARGADALLSAHRRQVRESSYVPAEPPMFRIH